MSAPPVSVVPKGDVLENFPTDPFVLSNQLFKNVPLKKAGKIPLLPQFGQRALFYRSEEPETPPYSQAGAGSPEHTRSSQ